jgi:D-xylose transport system substrate-binding protein
MNNWMKKSGVTALSIVFAISLTACGKSATTDATMAPKTDAAATEAPAAAKGDKKIVIGFSMDTLQEERWQ